MHTNHMKLAEEYYTLVGEKNVEGIKKYLHRDVEFYGPLATLKGKEAVIGMTSGFMERIKSLKIQASFASGDQAMIVYESDIPGISSHFPGASLMSFRDGLIVKIQLFFDASPFVEKK